MSTFLVLRQPLMLRLFSCVLLGALALMLAGGGLAAEGPWMVVGPVAGVLQSILVIRHWRLSVLASPDGLTIRNLFRTYEVPWSEVDRVPPSDGDLLIRLRDGRVITSSAFGHVPGAFPMVRRRNQAAAKQLSTAVARHRGR